VKHKIYLFAIALSFALFIPLSCSLDEIEREFDIDVLFSINENDTELYSIDTLDAVKEIPAIKEYGSNLRIVELLDGQIPLEVRNFMATDGLIINNAKLYVADIDGNNQTLLAAEFMQKPQDLIDTTINIATEKAGKDMLEKLLKDSPHQLLFILTGEGDRAPVDFDLKIKIKARITADAL
jgi:hypothetical protein